MTPPPKVLDGDLPFVDKFPDGKNALELFSGAWASRLPARFHDVPGQGSAGLFEDERILWAAGRLQEHGIPLAGADVLELGPLEAGHTSMLLQKGARRVTAVEANARAYVKCLVVKEVLGLTGASFLLGNALPFLRAEGPTYDVGVACAFLNHLRQPVEVIELLARRCRAVYVWNVVYGPALFEKQPGLRPHFGPPQAAKWGGFPHTLHPHAYGEVHDYRTFWGGVEPDCCWMEAEEVVAALRHFGFTRVDVRREPSPFGEAVGVVASRA